MIYKKTLIILIPIMSLFACSDPIEFKKVINEKETPKDVIINKTKDNEKNNNEVTIEKENLSLKNKERIISNDEKEKHEIDILTKKNELINDKSEDTAIVKVEEGVSNSNNLEDEDFKNILKEIQIDINENDSELKKMIITIKESYSERIKNTKKFYNEKRKRIDDEFNLKIKKAENDLSELSNKFKESCELFTVNNLSECNKMKSRIDDAETIIYKDRTEIDRYIKKVNATEFKDLETIKINFQKTVLDAKKSYILSK